MKDYTAVIKTEQYVEVCFYIEHEAVMKLGETMNGLREEAYMNGYNWEAVLTYYLGKTAPDLLEGMNTDPEAGMYVAYYPLTPENEAKAARFAGIIHDLVGHGETLCRLIQEEGDDIPWD